MRQTYRGSRRRASSRRGLTDLYAASMDIDAEHEALFEEVYDTEHLPALGAVLWRARTNARFSCGWGPSRLGGGSQPALLDSRWLRFERRSACEHRRG